MRHKSAKILVISIILLPILGYAFLHGLIILFPPDQSSGIFSAVLMAIFILVGLAVPFGILRFLSEKENMKNPDEPVVHLKDLPKNDNPALKH